MVLCRFPRGKRGLKFPRGLHVLPQGPSLPSREAWIEIHNRGRGASVLYGRFPRGKRGLKYRGVRAIRIVCCRFPRGKRGLKCAPGVASG